MKVSYQILYEVYKDYRETRMDTVIACQFFALQCKYCSSRAEFSFQNFFYFSKSDIILNISKEYPATNDLKNNLRTQMLVDLDFQKEIIYAECSN